MMMFMYFLTFRNFQYYNLWISLIGGILCLIVMFLIDWITALITFIVTIALYLFVSYRNPGEFSDPVYGKSNISQLLLTMSKYLTVLNSRNWVGKSAFNVSQTPSSNRYMRRMS